MFVNLNRNVRIVSYREQGKVPRPIATELHGQNPNEVVDMDFLYLGEIDKGDLKYGLGLKDDISAYSWLFPYANPDSTAATNSLEK